MSSQYFRITPSENETCLPKGEQTNEPQENRFLYRISLFKPSCRSSWDVSAFSDCREDHHTFHTDVMLLEDCFQICCEKQKKKINKNKTLVERKWGEIAEIPPASREGIHQLAEESWQGSHFAGSFLEVIDRQGKKNLQRIIST